MTNPNLDPKPYPRDTHSNRTTGGIIMRGLLLSTSILALASTAHAETFQLSSNVDAATVYPSGATITRSVTLDLPAGSHRLLIGDVPQDFDPSSLRIKGGEGLIIGATAIRTDRLPPDDRTIAARQEIEDKIDELRDLINRRIDYRTAIGLEVEAAEAQITYLESLAEGQENGGDTPPASVLAEWVGVIGAQTLSALQDAHDAKLRMAAVDEDITDLKEEMARLQQELEAVALPLTDRVIVSLDVSAEAAVTGSLQIEYVTNSAGWLPVYDVRLATTDEALTITRQAMLTQYTGESWDAVTVQLSTARPNLRLSPGEINAQLAYLYDPFRPGRDVMTSGAVAMDLAMEAPAEPVMEESRAEFAAVQLDFQGLTAVYSLPGGVTLDGDGTESLFTINSTDMEAELVAQATPLLDSSVYLMADFTNDSAAPFLPGQASFYRDGAFVGRLGFPMIAAGEDATLPFGAIDGLSTARLSAFRQTGESGVITTSNDRQERYLLSVENATSRAWDIRLIDRVPYSEEEDLEIAANSTPTPSETNIDGKRGVHAWDFTLEPGTDREVEVSFEIIWPEDKELGFQ